MTTSTSTRDRESPRPEPRVASPLAAGIAGALLLATSILAAPAPGPSAAELRVEAERLLRQNDLLRKRVELASNEKSFYLLLDPVQKRVQLLLRGAVLQDYAIQGLELGVPRVAFAARSLPEGWQGRIWNAGDLDPARPEDRLEIEAPPPGSAEEEIEPPPIPPTPEEKYPVPHRYRIRYEGGLSLEVRPRQADESAGLWARLQAGWMVWWHDAPQVIRGTPEDSLRLRLVLRPEDAASLYRALPPGTRLLVIPSV